MSQVDERFIADGAITNPKLDTDSVQGSNASGTNVIEAGSIDTADINGLAIETALIDALAVTAAKLGAVTGSTMTGGAGAVLDVDEGAAFTWTSNHSFSALPTSVATPSSATQLVTKEYVDAVAQGIGLKLGVRVRMVADIGGSYAAGGGSGGTGAFTGADLSTDDDGITLVTSNRVLLTEQTDPLENGIYLITDFGAGNLERSADMDSDANEAGVDEVRSDVFVFVSEGTVGANTGWVVSSAEIITLNSDAINFVQFSAAGQIVDGDGLAFSGLTLDVVVADLLGDGIVDDGGNNFEVDVASLVGDGIEDDGANNFRILPDPGASASLGGGDTVQPTVAAAGILVDVTRFDGDHLDVTFTPSNSTPATTPSESASVDDLAAHLFGIDEAIGNLLTTRDPDAQEWDNDPHTLSGGEVAASAFTLSGIVKSGQEARTIVSVGGVRQLHSVDYIITMGGTEVEWTGLGMITLSLMAGDVVQVMFPVAP